MMKIMNLLLFIFLQEVLQELGVKAVGDIIAILRHAKTKQKEVHCVIHLLFLHSIPRLTSTKMGVS